MNNRDEKKATSHRADLVREAARLTGRSIDSLAEPLLELSARRPYVEGRGAIYVVHPSVWDGTSDTIGMLSTMVDPEGSGTIPDPIGTTIHGNFTPLEDATHLIVLTFRGQQATMSLSGPWGTAVGHADSLSGWAMVAAVWTGGKPVSYTAGSQNVGGVVVRTIQVFAL